MKRMDKDRILELKERVYQFRSLELPGQPQIMHMGTNSLVWDLWKMIGELSVELEKRIQVERLTDSSEIQQNNSSDNGALSEPIHLFAGDLHGPPDMEPLCDEDRKIPHYPGDDKDNDD